MVQKYSLVFLMMVLQLTKTDWWSTKFHGKCMNFMLHCSINSYIPREVIGATSLSLWPLSVTSI